MVTHSAHTTHSHAAAGFDLVPFSDIALSPALLLLLIDRHQRADTPRLDLLWSYYRNPMEPRRTVGPSSPAGRHHLAQERGLPLRLYGGDVARFPHLGGRREIVIENDIAWRLGAMVDFLFGRPIRIVSQAADPTRRAAIHTALAAVWNASGGMTLLQDAALLGHVFGWVDLLVRRADPIGPPPDSLEAADTGTPPNPPNPAHFAAIEIVDARRGIAIQNPADYRKLDGYIVRLQRPTNRVIGQAAHPPDTTAAAPRTGLFGLRLLSNLSNFTRANSTTDPRRETETITEIFSAHARQVYRQRPGEPARLIEEDSNRVSPGALPVAHIQNVSQPLQYAGLSEVEPLLPLQDELNTRLSDRANRVTLQSFKMYLAKGIDGFDKSPVSPGTVWQTDNTDASIEAFGGDAASPSEQAHIDDIRQALDKASSVPPLAAGVVGAKIGNLTSENALRVTLQGILARTERKRLTYGRGIAHTCALVLAALHEAGILHTTPAERAVRILWPDPLPIATAGPRSPADQSQPQPQPEGVLIE